MNETQPGRRWTSPRNLLFVVALLVLVIASYAWRLVHLDTFAPNYDEGIHLIVGKLWAAGYDPYEEIFISYPPLFLWSLGVPWAIFRQAGALQLLMATYSLAGILAVVYLGVVYRSRLAGLAAGLFLSFAPAYFIDSFAVMTEVPSISLAVAAVALAEKYRRSGGWLWSALAGVALAFGLSLKVLPLYAIPLIGLMILSRDLPLDDGTEALRRLQESKGKRLRDVAVLAGSFLLIFLLPTLFFNVSTLFEQVVEMRLISREIEFNEFESNNEQIIDFLFSNPGLTALALYGLVFVALCQVRRYWLLLVWLGLVWLSMYWHVPLRDKHLPVFLPVLALFAGFAVDHIVAFARETSLRPTSLRTAAMTATIIVVLAMAGWSVPRMIAENSGQTRDQNVNEERQNAIAFIDEIATPDDCVIADNPVFLHQTGRLPPPELAETSQTRIDTGQLTLQDVIRAIQAYHCHVVAVVTPRFGESLPGLREWLAENYLGLHAQSETYVYFAKKEKGQDYEPIQDGLFGDQIRLYGSNQEPSSWEAAESGYLSLYWELTKPVQEWYAEQISLRDPQSGQVVHQFSRLPFEGQLDPGAWRVGDRARDTFRLDLPANLPPSTYDIYLSLCNSSEAETCLLLENTEAAEERQSTDLYVGQVTILP